MSGSPHDEACQIRVWVSPGKHAKQNYMRDKFLGISDF